MSNSLDCLKGEFKIQKEFLEYRFDELHKDMETFRGDQKEVNGKQDEKIQKLENQKWWNRGASAVGGVVGGVLTVLGIHGIKGGN